jgi:hypothetical protein
MTEHFRDDSDIWALFLQWVTEVERSEALPDHLEDEDKHFEANARGIAIRHAIFDLPSTSLRGLAMKVYLQMREGAGGARLAESGAVYRDSDADARESLDAHIWNSVLDDIVRLVPELAPFVKGAEIGFGEYVPPG